ncbi:hypothetical protein GQF61_04185 [Sphingobacterium sp. DK4209]|uniref:HK97 gp10 family phage protein n=1 Tax=Sphingobacterium zhuxiongii TaxID=2662364 RepID=A0A5Q0Q5N1_9SPHI|nr:MULTISPECIES: hypothetical protein [unclassified Sphingobacterium]MVZ65038.1 hypothetical protein [Sphingobacterium sp. DK4209]QGA25375.1 hypothetical protein GFH32_03140 [Sphingobacterium sp. dk4302]
MAKGAIINTVGRDLEKYRKDVLKKVKDLIAEFASQLEIDAIRDLDKASSDRDYILDEGLENLNFIHIDKKFTNSGFKAEVGVMGENDLAAYIEFGTGLSAKEILAPYPQEIRDIAMKFYVNGQGIMQGHPYLYNNYLRLMHAFRVELDKILKVKRKS